MNKAETGGQGQEGEDSRDLFFSPDAFLVVLRELIADILEAGGDSPTLQYLELWEKRVLDLTGAYDGDPDDYVIGVHKRADSLTFSVGINPRLTGTGPAAK